MGQSPNQYSLQVTFKFIGQETPIFFEIKSLLSLVPGGRGHKICLELVFLPQNKSIFTLIDHLSAASLIRFGKNKRKLADGQQLQNLQFLMGVANMTYNCRNELN